MYLWLGFENFVDATLDSAQKAPQFRSSKNARPRAKKVGCDGWSLCRWSAHSLLGAENSWEETRRRHLGEMTRERSQLHSAVWM